jgi:ABC-type phosphate transport system substrate-binding protein
LEGTVTISGTFSLYPMMIRWAEEYHSLHPEVTFDFMGEVVEDGPTRSILEHSRQPRTQAYPRGEFTQREASTSGVAVLGDNAKIPVGA